MRRLKLLYSRRQTFFRYALWACLAAIAFLSLVPGQARPHTGAPGELEHFIAYMGTGLFIAARYRSFQQRLNFWALVAALSFLLELIQNLVPGRDPDLFDALASSSGLTAGVVAGGLLIRAAHSRRPDFFEQLAVD